MTRMRADQISSTNWAWLFDGAGSLPVPATASPGDQGVASKEA
ncbi:MAG: hypothetical protein ABWZ77_03635 [Naasia sp.]